MKTRLSPRCIVATLSAVNRLTLTMVFVSASCHGQQTHQAPPASLKPVEIGDAISTTRLADPEYFEGAPAEGHIAQFSPDGQHFVIVLRHADIAKNLNVYSVYLFETDGVLRAAKRRLVIQMSSSSNREAIRNIRWRADNKSFTFIGENPATVAQVYLFDIQTNQATTLTDAPASIVNYAISQDSDTIVYLTEPITTAIKTVGSLDRKAITIADQWISDILAGHISRDTRSLKMFVQTLKDTPLHVGDGTAPEDSLLSISPDGHYAISTERTRVGELPRAGAGYVYHPENDYAHFFFTLKDQDISTPFIRYLLIDLHDGSWRYLWQLPSWGANPVAWASDSKSVFLKEMYLPERGNESQKKSRSEMQPSSIRLSLDGSKWGVIAASEWPEQQSIQPAVKIIMKESLNMPPTIGAQDVGSAKEVTLIDLNPQLASLKLGKVEVLSFMVHGVMQECGLYLPPDFTTNKRYPLVIQTHGFDPDRFSMDGRNEWTSGFAARALAAHGIVVLQAEAFERPTDYDVVGNDRSLGRNELESFRTFAGLVWEEAIKSLDKRGMIDVGKVGIIGFSRTVWFVDYVLTRPGARYAAAVLTDGVDASYFNYLAFQKVEFEQDNGGKAPFGTSGLELWMKEAPGFNLDKVHTPIRIFSLDTGPGILEAWETFSGLKLQGKPVELTALEDGAHLLQRPSDRVVVMGGIVDWFRFWLQGYEDPDRAKTEQYKLWEHLRDLQNAENKEDIQPSTAKPN